MFSKETKDKMRKSAKKRWAKLNLEERNKILSKTRSYITKETYKKIGNALSQYYKTPKGQKEISKQRKEWWSSLSKEEREKQKQIRKEYWDNLSKEKRERRIKTFINAPRHKIKDTKIELKVQKQLDILGIQYIKQKYIYNKKIKRGFYIDFFLPNYKGYEILIECNGSYWHNLPKRKERDKILKAAVNKKDKKHPNLKLVEIWDNEINENDNIVKDKLSGICKVYNL